MNKQPIKHEVLLHNAAYGAAEKLVNIALSQKNFKDFEISESSRTAMIIEIYKLNMFMVFGVLYDAKHKKDPRMQKIAKRLKKIYDREQTEGLKQAWEELKHIPEATKVWEEAGVFNDPFDDYIKAVNSGSKDFNATPFGILATKLSNEIFPNELQKDAYTALAYLMPQAAVEVINCIDNPPRRFEIIEEDMA